MRASVHVALPYLAKSGGIEGVEAVAKPLGLSVRGLGGEHTAIGEDGTVDISPSARFCVSEAQIIGNLYKGVWQLSEAEATAKDGPEEDGAKRTFRDEAVQIHRAWRATRRGRFVEGVVGTATRG